MTENKYPECDKMLAVKDESQCIGEFIDWLKEEKTYSICELVDGEEEMEYCPIQASTEKLLAEYFNIDLNKVEKEKKQILEELRERNK